MENPLFNQNNPMIPWLRMQVELTRQCTGAMVSGLEAMSQLNLNLARQAAARQLDMVQRMPFGNGAQPAAPAAAGGNAAPTPLAQSQEALRLLATMQSELGKAMARNLEQGTQAWQAAAKGALPGAGMEAMLGNPLQNLAGIWSAAAQSMEQGAGLPWLERRTSHQADRRVSRVRDRRTGAPRAAH